MTLSEPLNTMLNDITDEAEALAGFMAMILHNDEPNNIKLDIIKEAIQTGQYQVHPENIMNKLLEFSPLVEETVA